MLVRTAIAIASGAALLIGSNTTTHFLTKKSTQKSASNSIEVKPKTKAKATTKVKPKTKVKLQTKAKPQQKPKLQIGQANIASSTDPLEDALAVSEDDVKLQFEDLMKHPTDSH